MDRVVLDDEQIDYSAEISKLILAWFATKLMDTASYAIAQAVNSGRNSVWDDDDDVRGLDDGDGLGTDGQAKLLDGGV